MMVHIKADSGNKAYSQPSSRLLWVETQQEATALAVARLWATTQETMMASQNEIVCEVVEAPEKWAEHRP